MNVLIPGNSQVLVTGATGYTGRVLVEKLVRTGCRVRAIARESSDITPLAGLQIDWRRGEIFDPETVTPAMEGVDYIFHVAAAFRDPKSTEQDYWNVHVRSTQLLAEQAARSASFKRFVHVSTMGVHGHIVSPPADENTPFAPGDGYQRTKAEAEIWLASYGREHGLSYTIIRPCAIYGPGERRLLKLYRMAAKPFFPVLGSGKCWYHLVHVEDLTNAMLTAAVHEKAVGESFLIGSITPIQLEEMARMIAAEYGRSLRIIRLPIAPFFLLADLCEAACRPMKVEPPIYRRRVAFYSKDRYFSTLKMRDVLGCTPIYENKQGIIESARWYREHGWVTP
jgi:nucleoside-diphosphate-sugar epimerase